MLYLSIPTSLSHEDILNERADINEPLALLSQEQGRTTLGVEVTEGFLLRLRQLIVLRCCHYIIYC